MSAGATLRAYLELARLSNAPTVVSNGLAGSALGALAAGTRLEAADSLAVLASVLAITAFYAAGMALNDLVDRAVDAAERPHRPIPSGRVSPRGAAALASGLVLGGLWLLSTVSTASLVAGIALLVLIVLYDLVHGRSVLTVLLMGACRAMTYVVAALAFAPLDQPTIVIGPALCLLVYVAGFSVIARQEAVAFESLSASRAGGAPAATAGSSRTRPHLSLLLPVVLLVAFAFLPENALVRFDRSGREIALLAGTITVAGFLAAWLSAATRRIELRPPRIGEAVTMWIAGIALFDAFLLLLARSVELAIAAVVCFLITRWAQRRIAGT